MFSNQSQVRRFLIATFFLLIPVQNAISAPEGVVNYAIQWGSNKAAYTYVFSGLISCQNRPCSNARVEVALVTPSQGAVSQSVRAGDDGRYQVAITVPGSPEDASTWKIDAYSASVSEQATGEAEGSIILMEDQKTVVVDRTIQLIQA